MPWKLIKVISKFHFWMLGLKPYLIFQKFDNVIRCFFRIKLVFLPIEFGFNPDLINQLLRNIDNHGAVVIIFNYLIIFGTVFVELKGLRWSLDVVQVQNFFDRWTFSGSLRSQTNYATSWKISLTLSTYLIKNNFAFVTCFWDLPAWLHRTNPLLVSFCSFLRRSLVFSSLSFLKKTFCLTQQIYLV